MTSSPILLDGRAYARARARDHAERAQRVRAARGRAPFLHLIGFGEAGVAPFSIARKLRACEAAGVEASARVLAEDATTKDIVDATVAMPGATDGLFLEFPFPSDVDVDAVIAAVPERVDVDIMTDARVAAFFERSGPPPATVSAALGLLDDGDVSIAGLRGVVVAERMPFTEMFAESLARRGADMTLVAPTAAASARDAQLVVVSAASPGLLRARELAAGAVVIDAGYFNPGGIGDVDLSSGIEHLRALAPVPGGIGPATVAMLVERVIEFAEGKY